MVVLPLGPGSTTRLDGEILASTARWRVAAEHSIMWKSELRTFNLRAEAVAKLTGRFCILRNLGGRIHTVAYVFDSASQTRVHGKHVR